MGDTTFSAFSSNKFGVDKLNEITADIVGKGILKTATDSNGNSVMGCEPIISGDNILIQNGVIVFESGAKIRITSPVSVPKIKYTYIYAINDLATGTASIQVLSSELTSGDYVLLAVMKYNVLEDARAVATAKVALPAASDNVSETLTFAKTVYRDSPQTIYVSFAGWKYFIYTTSKTYAIDLTDGLAHIIPDTNSGSHYRGTVQKSNNALIFSTQASYTQVDFNLTFEIR